MLELRSKAKGNIEFGKLRRRLGVEPVSAQKALRVADMYGRRPEIYRRLTWAALVARTAPSLPVRARIEIEAEIIAGGRFSHAQIRAQPISRRRGRRHRWRWMRLGKEKPADWGGF